MPRKPDPTRKPELLAQILEHLTGRTLATVSFRSLADALGVSSYVFVYHFGSRAQLVDEIVHAIVARHDALLAVDPAGLDEAAWRQLAESAWAEVSRENNLHLQRLEFEAAMLEMVEGQTSGVARSAVGRWHEFALRWASSRGVAAGEAQVEARLFTDAVYGLQYDALTTGDVDEVARAFTVLVDAFALRVRELGSTSVV